MSGPAPADDQGFLNALGFVPSVTPVQAKGDVDGTGVHEAATRGLEAPQQPYPHMDRIASAFGEHTPKNIQAHIGEAATQANESMGAMAYASGQQVAFKEAPDVHTAAHEAAHVVQQQRGVNLQDGVGQEGDAYERQADAVADAVIAGTSAVDLLGTPAGGSAASPAVQRKAITADALPGTVDNGEGAIFDSKMAQGRKFTLEADVAEGSWDSVIGAYTANIRPLGNAVSDAWFTDRRLTFQNNLPSPKTWGQKRQSFIESAKAELRMDGGISKDTHPDRDFWAALSAPATKAGDRNLMRNRDDIGLIDPFLIEMVLHDGSAPGAADWRFLTQFADSGAGYITEIYNGAQAFGGSITTAQQFAANRNADAGDNTSYLYSSTHEQGGTSFAERMAGSGADKEKRGDNAAGLDAVTWLAAEGARFAPIAALGSAGSPESHFFVKPNADSWDGYKYLTASDLMQRWLTAFDKRYNVATATVRAVVEATGKSDVAEPPVGWHYNLTDDASYQHAPD